MRAFPDQAKALRPERSAAGGVKARSTPERIRMQIYNAIKKLYLERHPFCETCWLINRGTPGVKFGDCCNLSSETHHRRGKLGWLLIDTRHWLPVCNPCHRWIHDHPEEARKLGLLAPRGKWHHLE